MIPYAYFRGPTDIVKTQIGIQNFAFVQLQMDSKAEK